MRIPNANGSDRRSKRRQRAVSNVLGVVLLVAIVLLLSITTMMMSASFADRLDSVETVEFYDDERCAGDQILEFSGDFDSFHDQLRNNPCALWLDAEHAVTDGSGRVEKWTDRGPHQYHAKQTDGTMRPTLEPAGSGPGGINAPAVVFENNASLRPGCTVGGSESHAGCSGGGNTGIRYYDEGDYLGIDRDVDDLNVDEDSGMAVAAVLYTERFDRGGTWTIGEAGGRGREFSMRTCGADRTFGGCGYSGSGPTDHWRAQHWRRADVDFEAPSQGQWIVLIHAYDGEETTIRVDGTELAQESTDLDLSNDRDVQIGRWERTAGDPSFYYDGAIAELLVFDRAMTDEELADLEAYFDRRYGVVDV